MKAKNTSTFAKVFCLVVVLVWGLGTWAQTEEVVQTDTTAQSQSQTQQQPTSQRPRTLVMGQVRSSLILPRMPQYVAMQESLNALKQQYEAEAKKSESDFQRKFEEFMQGQKDFPKTILEKRQNELQIMLETNAEFRIKAQKLLAEAERSMLADVKAELDEAIAVVAKENGVGIVFDLDGGSVPYVEQGLVADITDAVIHLLGVGATVQDN